MRTTEAKAAPKVSLPISDEQMEYEASWEKQIHALTAPGLSDWERVRRFLDAAELNDGTTPSDYFQFMRDEGFSPARVVWLTPWTPRSLFANLPGCQCPVNERLEGVPQGDDEMPHNWHPTAAQLRIFAHHQREARFGS